MNEEQNYSALQQAKSQLETALEDIKKYDKAIGGDGEKGTFNSEVHGIIEQVFPNYLDY